VLGTSDVTWFHMVTREQVLNSLLALWCFLMKCTYTWLSNFRKGAKQIPVCFSSIHTTISTVFFMLCLSIIHYFSWDKAFNINFNEILVVGEFYVNLLSSEVSVSESYKTVNHLLGRKFHFSYNIRTILHAFHYNFSSALVFNMFI
jgi:hypothetical protein